MSDYFYLLITKCNVVLKRVVPALRVEVGKACKLSSWLLDDVALIVKRVL